MHRSRSVRRVEVTTDGKNLVSHAGTALLSELADRSGLTGAMSEAMAGCGTAWHTHDPGVVLTHLAVAIADGADCLTDFEALREQSELHGDVASVSTAWRAVKKTTSLELRQIPRAAARAREVIWLAAPPGDITIDVDATLLNVHSEKQQAASTYKRGYGFHPLGAWCDTTNEPLAAILRPGNAGSNDTDDHLELLDQALAVLPATYRAGHEPGDDPALVSHQILLRADSAGATHGFVAGLVEANIEYSIGHHVNSAVHGSSAGASARTPVPSSRCSTCPRAGGIPASSPAPMRSRSTRRSWKDCGLASLPFASFTQNLAWVAVSLLAGALLAWAQMTCLDGALKKAEPKTLRYRVLHVAAVLVRRGRRLVLRLDETWPWASALRRAFLRLRTTFP